jgi:fermentation-respiration switch protein FrsA (DUF1100 family)
MSLFLSSCISYNLTEKDVFHPQKVSKLSDSLSLEDVYFMTSDSIKLNGWFIKHYNPKGTILYFGGNYGSLLWNRFTFDAIDKALSSFDMNLFIIDYRGYGRSDGTPTLQGIYEDGRAAFKYLCSRPDVDSSRIIVYGHSLGSLVAVKTGCSQPVAGIILEGAISNSIEMKDILLKLSAPWYMRWLVNLNTDSTVSTIDNIKQVQHLEKPLLIVVGENDIITPPEMGKEVYTAAASTNKWFEIIPKGDHDDLYFSNDGRRDSYKKVVSKFIDGICDKKK